jgi:hypothetical protein
MRVQWDNLAHFVAFKEACNSVKREVLQKIILEFWGTQETSQAE